MRSNCRGLVAAVALAAFGCEYATTARGPERGDAYVLRTVAGMALPVVVRASEGIATTLVADTIWLADNGRGSETRVFHYQSNQPLDEPGYTERSTFTWELAGDRLTVSFDCPDFGSCIAPPHYVGVLRSDGLRLDYAITMPTPRWFERIAPQR